MVAALSVEDTIQRAGHPVSLLCTAARHDLTECVTLDIMVVVVQKFQRIFLTNGSIRPTQTQIPSVNKCRDCNLTLHDLHRSLHFTSLR